MKKLLFISIICLFACITTMLVMNNQIIKQKQLINALQTDTITETDTLYLETEIIDTMPKYITQRIYKTDTLYKKMPHTDSIEATPILISLKKKIIKRQ